MYVVRRPFRNKGHVMLPGSVVEPGDIKMFKSRLRDRVIVEVTEHNFNEYTAYFKEKFGVTIASEPAKEPAELANATEVPAKAKAKAVVKAR